MISKLFKTTKFLNLFKYCYSLIEKSVLNDSQAPRAFQLVNTLTKQQQLQAQNQAQQQKQDVLKAQQQQAQIHAQQQQQAQIQAQQQQQAVLKAQQQAQKINQSQIVNNKNLKSPTKTENRNIQENSKNVMDLTNKTIQQQELQRQFILQQQYLEQQYLLQKNQSQKSLRQSPPKPISPNTQLYHQLVKLLSNPTPGSENNLLISSQIEALLANPKIKSQLKQLHSQLLQNPDLYIPQLEQIVLASSTSSPSSSTTSSISAKQPLQSSLSGKSNFTKNFKKGNVSFNLNPTTHDLNPANSINLTNDLLDLKSFYTTNSPNNNNKTNLSQNNVGKTLSIAQELNKNLF